MWRIGIVAAGLTLIAVASWTVEASANNCVIPIFCSAFAGSGHAQTPNAAGSGHVRHPLQLATVARSKVSRQHAGLRGRVHRMARHRSHGEEALGFSREDGPRVLAEEREPDRQGTEAPEAETLATIVPLLDWAEHDDRVAAVVAASHTTRFDLVAEWRRAVGEIAMMDTVPEETLKSFNAFPP